MCVKQKCHVSEQVSNSLKIKWKKRQHVILMCTALIGAKASKTMFFRRLKGNAIL